MAHKKCWNCIWLECDSSLVVDISKGKGSPPWMLLNKWLKCRDILASMDYKVTHIFREDNVCADRLANYGISSNCFTFWDTIPQFLLYELMC
ncbi:putative ribonuclease H-like domain-containing protein [Lupinus albus]|uniref:Putative ribonuclease H-like domain-containing protein n=1 Tax=Lupinus albus TaxID=3870 RepID=A0A6A4R1V3_LUPAL|nr:putative ribonuclease H-like domain-containing protein [Lupinus albus]